MSGFLYFLSGAREGQARELLAMRGLGYVVADGLRTRGCNTGPGKAPGVIVADRDRVPTAQIGYFPDRQTWRRVPGQAEAWVGMTNEARPGPTDLARESLVAGEDVELGDGNLWHVPHAIDYGGAGLDRTMQLGEDGRWTEGDVVPGRKWLWDLAWQWREAIDELISFGDRHKNEAGEASYQGYDDPRLYADWILSKSSQVLGVNYALGQAEAAMLGLFVSGRMWAVLQALCDASGLAAIIEAAGDMQKKTDDMPATSPGSDDGSRAIGRPSRT